MSAQILFLLGIYQQVSLKLIKLPCCLPALLQFPTQMPQFRLNIGYFQLLRVLIRSAEHAGLPFLKIAHKIAQTYMNLMMLDLLLDVADSFLKFQPSLLQLAAVIVGRRTLSYPIEQRILQLAEHRVLQTIQPLPEQLDLLSISVLGL